MRILKALALFVLPVLFILSCKKEKSLESGGVLGNAAWEFKESGVDFKGVMDSAYIETSGTLEALFLECTSNDGSGTFLIQIVAADITTGTFTSPNLLFQYIVGGNVYYESDPTNTGQFTVVITQMDSVTVSGTFSGEVIDALGAKKTITNGRFTGKFNNNNNPPPPQGDGQLMFWAEQLCPGSGNILIKIQGQQASITAASATEPTCGTATGNALFTLPAGNYAFKAFCGTTDSTEGVVTVVAAACTSVKITFSGPPTGNQCRISDIAYYDRISGTAEGAITSFFNASNQVNRVQLYDSVAGQVDNNFNITYPTARVQVDPNQYFTLDPSQRVKEWHGKIDPTNAASQSVVIIYQYDGLGYMQKASIAVAAAPTVTVLDITYTWTSGNLTKVVISEIGTGGRTEIEYQYDSRQARNFLSFFPNSEIIIFQSAINYGKNSTNVPIKSIIKDYDASNTLLNTDTSNFINYVIDPNGYIKSFEITGDDSVYGTDTKYVLTYKCA